MEGLIRPWRARTRVCLCAWVCDHNSINLHALIMCCSCCFYFNFHYHPETHDASMCYLAQNRRHISTISTLDFDENCLQWRHLQNTTERWCWRMTCLRHQIGTETKSATTIIRRDSTYRVEGGVSGIMIHAVETFVVWILEISGANRDDPIIRWPAGLIKNEFLRIIGLNRRSRKSRFRWSVQVIKVQYSIQRLMS